MNFMISSSGRDSIPVFSSISKIAALAQLSPNHLLGSSHLEVMEYRRNSFFLIVGQHLISFSLPEPFPPACTIASNKSSFAHN